MIGEPLDLGVVVGLGEAEAFEGEGDVVGDGSLVVGEVDDAGDAHGPGDDESPAVGAEADAAPRDFHGLGQRKDGAGVSGAFADSVMNGIVCFFGGTQLSFSPGRNSQRQSAGRKMIAATMFTMNMKVSITPMSAWNLSGENTQVATPIASVMPVKMMLAPVTRIVRS